MAKKKKSTSSSLAKVYKSTLKWALPVIGGPLGTGTSTVRKALPSWHPLSTKKKKKKK